MRACMRSRKLCKKMRKNYICQIQKLLPTTHMHDNSDTHAQRMLNACVSDRRIQSVLLLWTSSLNDHTSKLKGQCTDVKSGCGPSVGPSLSPLSLN